MAHQRNLKWETLGGQRLRGNEVSRHHVFFAKNSYNTQTERICRSKTGLILPLSKVAHNGLHRVVEAPIKPTVDVMLDFNEYMHQEPDISSYLQFGRAMLYMMDMCDSPKHGGDANKLLDNFYQQKRFIDDGYVVPMELA